MLIESELDPWILRTCLRSIVQRFYPLSKPLKRYARVWLNLDCPVVQWETLAPSKLLLWDVEVVWHLGDVISIDTEALVSFFAAWSNDPSPCSSWDLGAYHWYGHFFETFKSTWRYLGISQMNSSLTQPSWLRFIFKASERIRIRFYVRNYTFELCLRMWLLCHEHSVDGADW